MVKNYFIGCGTGIVNSFDTLDEMFVFHKTLPSLDKHFCKLYDCVKNRLIDGWAISGDYSDTNYAWRCCR